MTSSPLSFSITSFLLDKPASQWLHAGNIQYSTYFYSVIKSFTWPLKKNNPTLIFVLPPNCITVFLLLIPAFPPTTEHVRCCPSRSPQIHSYLFHLCGGSRGLIENTSHSQPGQVPTQTSSGGVISGNQTICSHIYYFHQDYRYLKNTNMSQTITQNRQHRNTFWCGSTSTVHWVPHRLGRQQR